MKRRGPAVSLTVLEEMDKSLKIFNSRVESIDKAFDQLIEDEEDLKRMELTKHAKDPSLYSKPIAETVNADIDILLEYCDRELDGLTARVKELDEGIRSTERQFNLRMGILRNRILQVDLYASMIHLGLGFGTCISGIFGMNLLSNLEENPHMFVAISSTISIVVGLSTLAIVWLRCGVGL
eukprot:GHVP01051179.1.p1 GENE.GHVP01051179.1~~GHVP01051179.1.p1  ORF type:complete len:181 (-),score=18.71 GHVP01051179.1:63-605(-)